MQTTIYDRIEQVGAERIALLPGSPVDFSFGLLQAVERILWGDIRARYVAVEEGPRLLGFLPVYVGTNVKFMAAMPPIMGQGYDWMTRYLGSKMGYKVSVGGSLMSDRGWLPMADDCDQPAVLAALLGALDEISRAEKVDLSFLKDIHQDFPQLEGLRKAKGFTEMYSLPTVRVDTGQKDLQEYIGTLSANGRSHARRALKKAAKVLTYEVVKDFAPLVAEAYPCWRSTYLKARFKVEELPPLFFELCAHSTTPETELHVVREQGRMVGAYMVLYTATQQLNKRVGVDYSSRHSALIYNIMHYRTIESAIQRGISDSYYGQTTYTPKLRLGGVLEDQFLFVKPYSLMVAPSMPPQKAWMRRYRAEMVLERMEKKRLEEKARSAARREAAKQKKALEQKARASKEKSS